LSCSRSPLVWLAGQRAGSLGVFAASVCAFVFALVCFKAAFAKRERGGLELYSPRDGKILHVASEHKSFSAQIENDSQYVLMPFDYRAKETENRL